MNVLGISAFYHDSAAALVRDGKVLAAAQEERFTRKKNDSEFPIRSVEYCLEEAGLGLDDLRAPHFSAAGGDELVERHVLGLERGHADAVLQQDATQRRRQHALAGVGTGALDHQRGREFLGDRFAVGRGAAQDVS